ncbi:hypothetical protein HC928_23680 [bacterium]|nr:hypothetical protein [bacterium]
MAHEYRRSHMGLRGCLLLSLLMLLGLLGIGGGFYAAIDISCVSAAAEWLPDYPGAELVEQTHSFIRPWGVGETTRILYTPDAPFDVNTWYRDGDLERTREGKSPTSGPARMRWFVREADDGGSTILLFSNCSSGLVLF